MNPLPHPSRPIMTISTGSSSSTPIKSRSSMAISTPGPLTPTRRLNQQRSCVTTPPRKHKSTSSLCKSPSITRTATTPTKSPRPAGPTWTSDRFIPNRSGLQMDLAQSCIENAERNLSSTFDKLSKRKNASPSRRGSPDAVQTGSVNEESIVTPLQQEFRRRMRGALLNLPLEDVNRSSVRTVSNANSPARTRDDTSVSNSSTLFDNRENVSSIVYAPCSFPDEDYENQNRRMLSFQGMSSRDYYASTSSSSFRSSNGSLREDSDIMSTSTPSTPQRRLFSSSSCPSISTNFHQPPMPPPDPFAHDQLHVLHRLASSNSITSTESRHVTKSHIGRRIPKTPSRILDAPELVDDYYLNLVSWGENNVLAVALGQCVYLWEAETGNIRHLLTLRGEDDFVTSVAWATVRGCCNYIAVGTNHNAVQLWDAEAERRVRSLDGHSARVGALSWNQHWLSSGGRDSQIIQHDVRSRNHIVSTYIGHTQEVCGLKWNDEGSTLASGGNENLLCLWDASMSRRGNNGGFNNNNAQSFDSSNIGPRLTLTQHKAAVKALAWCPFHRGLLASGGGTADRTIKFWNTNSGAVLNSIDTGSQVCSLLWSKHQREICSSHGFSENQLLLWKYPTMTKIQEFKGHTARVLHMDQSPDSGCVVSAAADETLRFWDVFGSPPNERKGRNLTMGNFCGSSMIR